MTSVKNQGKVMLSIYYFLYFRNYSAVCLLVFFFVMLGGSRWFALFYFEQILIVNYYLSHLESPVNNFTNDLKSIEMQ